jgi:hypothetical protein
MFKYMNMFHTLWSKLGIKASEKHLDLMYRKGLYRNIQKKMELLDIYSLGATCWCYQS